MEKKSKYLQSGYFRVLILIVMEDTHGEQVQFIMINSSVRLNPYCNGRYSWSLLRSLLSNRQ